MNSRSLLVDRLIGWDAPNDEIKAKLVEHRLGATRLPIILVNNVVAIMLAAIFWSTKPHPLLVCWIVGIACVSLLLAWNRHVFTLNRTLYNPTYWASRFMLGAFANGLIWGFGALLLFEADAPALNILMVGVICGMSAGYVVTSFAVPGAAYAFLIPASLLCMVMPIVYGSPTESALALLWLPYMAIMIFLTRSAHNGIAESVRLSHENGQLAARLSAAKESAEKLSLAKSDFLAVVSHEIRTPMHGMLGITHLLSKTDLDDKQKLYIEYLQNAGDYLAQLINNILDYSRIEAGRLSLYEHPFSLPELIDEVVKLFALQAQRKGLILQSTISGNSTGFLHGDAYHLKQVLVNLLGNAMKFTDKGSISLEVIELNDGDESSAFTFRVSDTGSGIEPGRVAEIFEPFTQATHSLAEKGGGTGLGLAISRHLVEVMGGKLEVDSRVDRGSSFFFSLRFARATNNSPLASTLCNNNRLQIAPLNVLVADDAPLNLLVLREFLSDTPCRIDEASNGREALLQYQRKRHDVILIDMHMPEMDGVEAIAKIRTWERTQHVEPALIVMLTASSVDRERASELMTGCDTLLIKPVKKEELVTLLYNHSAELIVRRSRTVSH